MPPLFEGFSLAFIPVFVAIDAIGVLPIYMGLSEQVHSIKRRKVVGQALLTAALLCAFFLFLGQAVFKLLGITLQDFMVAGGAVLFAIAIRDLLGDPKNRHRAPESFGVVPLGTPLIAGPALLTTTLMMSGQVGEAATLLAIGVNLLLTGALFLGSGWVLKLIRPEGARAASKVAHLLLAAIAVMMIRKGLMAMLGK
jgi:multiple antibiotic resistance protein